ncbi:aspartate racemase [Stipitochalara longipes BDJ]|nr:aspartate racemase [Stipitochalara longipes BDJ]
MRTLGLIGGISYHATTLYYSQINEHVQKVVGGGQSAKIVLHSFAYADIMAPFHAGEYKEFGRQISAAGKNLQSIGAEAIVICANTAHLWADEIEKAAGIPVLHIIDFTAAAILNAGVKKVVLLGTRATMEGDFIIGRLEKKFGIQALIPAEEVRKQMDEVIFKELSLNIVTAQTKKLYIDAVEDLVRQGAQGVILGCTELQFVLKPDDISIPLFDTVELHARGAAQ